MYKPTTNQFKVNVTALTRHQFIVYNKFRNLDPTLSSVVAQDKAYDFIAKLIHEYVQDYKIDPVIDRLNKFLDVQDL